MDNLGKLELGVIFLERNPAYLYLISLLMGYKGDSISPESTVYRVGRNLEEVYQLISAINVKALIIMASQSMLLDRGVAIVGLQSVEDFRVSLLEISQPDTSLFLTVWGNNVPHELGTASSTAMFVMRPGSLQGTEQMLGNIAAIASMQRESGK